MLFGEVVKILSVIFLKVSYKSFPFESNIYVSFVLAFNIVALFNFALHFDIN